MGCAWLTSRHTAIGLVSPVSAGPLFPPLLVVQLGACPHARSTHACTLEGEMPCIETSELAVKESSEAY